MKELSQLDKAERSLLLFLETRAVDYGGRVDIAHMNGEDIDTARQWNIDGFVSFGRIASEHINQGDGSHWCNLSESAWDIVASERKARAARNWGKRSWWTTEEKRAN